MKRFAHIGMPKTLTSALQETFFAQHDEIHFLGVGVGSLIDFVNDDINIIFETLILYATENYYRENKDIYKAGLEQEISKARKTNKTCIGVSSEWLSFNFSPEMVDPELKIRRLSYFMGSDAHIILFTRSQASLLKSLYAELVKVGYSKDFFEYCAYLWNFRERSALQDYCYDIHYQRLARYFEKERIHILPLESYRQANGHLVVENSRLKIIQDLCSILGVSYPEDFILPKINPSLNVREVEQKLSLNRKYRHDFGNLLFEPANIHRSRKQLERNQQIGITDYFEDVKIKRLLIDSAKRAANTKPQRDIYRINGALSGKLEELFRLSNERFESLSGLCLPECYYVQSI